MPARRGNRNAAGQRVQRERVGVSLSLSEGNGLLPLFVEYLSRQGEDPTREQIIELASEWAYQGWRKRLEDELSKDERLSVQVEFMGMYGEGATTTSAVAFGKEEAEVTRQRMIERLKSEGRTIIGSHIVPDKASQGSAGSRG